MMELLHSTKADIYGAGGFDHLSKGQGLGLGQAKIEGGERGQAGRGLKKLSTTVTFRVSCEMWWILLNLFVFRRSIYFHIARKSNFTGVFDDTKREQGCESGMCGFPVVLVGFRTSLHYYFSSRLILACFKNGLSV